ncbi:ArsC family reductase [Ferrimonas lipolytica]|uniref:ArsC family reductase n=1 Tax=Ferrimonas lipolytica TaxID=2724191 RepID=A0A6H1UE60_9GAMM|nr:ArsC family reductase [Ferrimonas lipolytica]QIZ76880.1 ArsC family reductase [Ferrimonas lipolytica]
MSGNNLVLFGIKNCDTVKKARKHLEQQSRPYQFHDFREQGLDLETVERWLTQVEFKVLLNTRSTSWRQLDDSDKQDVDQAKAIELMLANPTLVKRPVIELGTAVTVGFKPADFEQWVAQHD